MPSERFASSGAALAHAVKAWLQLKVQQRVRVRLPRAHAAPLQLPALLPRHRNRPACGAPGQVNELPPCAMYRFTEPVPLPYCARSHGQPHAGAAHADASAQATLARRSRAGQRGPHLEDAAQAGGELRRAGVGHGLAPVRDPARVELAAERRRPARRVERALGGKGGGGVRAGAKVHGPADPNLSRPRPL